MQITVDDFFLACRLGVDPISREALKILKIERYWIKVNSGANGNPDLVGGGGIFRNSLGFVKCAFTTPLGSCFAFEAELTSVCMP